MNKVNLILWETSKTLSESQNDRDACVRRLLLFKSIFVEFFVNFLEVHKFYKFLY